MFDMDSALIEKPLYHEERSYEIETTATVASIEKPVLVLYSRSTCPYCQRVMKYLKSVHKAVPTKDIGKNSAAAKELVRIGGKRQVPCLVINGKPLYESSDIIRWLKDNPNKF